MKKKIFSILISLSIVLTAMMAMTMTAMATTDKVEGIQAEQDLLRNSGVAGTLYSSSDLWSSVEYSGSSAYLWGYGDTDWFNDVKNCTFGAVALRAF